MERTTDGQPLRILVVDDFTRECLGTLVARNIGAGDVKRFLAKLFARHGKPQFLRSDHGREFTAEWDTRTPPSCAPPRHCGFRTTTPRCTALRLNSASTPTKSWPSSAGPVDHAIPQSFLDCDLTFAPPLQAVQLEAVGRDPGALLNHQVE